MTKFNALLTAAVLGLTLGCASESPLTKMGEIRDLTCACKDAKCIKSLVEKSREASYDIAVATEKFGEKEAAEAKKIGSEMFACAAKFPLKPSVPSVP